MATETYSVPPHCDERVLHAPGECDYCDSASHLQQARLMWGINFAGHHEPDLALCPAELQRPIAIINRWPGNQASRRTTRFNQRP